jgi:hypothetical protein
MRPRLLTTIVATTLLATAYANDSPARATWTLACNAGVPASVACYVERPVYQLGPLEIAIGVDARARRDSSSVAAYLITAYYAPTWSVWGEVRLPEIVPPIGATDWLRIGFTMRFGGP